VKEFFAKMMNSKDPTVSSGVFLSVVTVLTVLYAWGIVSIVTEKIQDIPTGVYTFVGLVIAGKVGSIIADRPSTNTSSTTSTESSSKVKVSKGDGK
jgi:uncharacterized membrane-anchored protein YitT (DUF2179 family)